MTMHCGFCGKDELHNVTETSHFEHRGKSLEVPGYTYSVCGACGEEVVTFEQMKLNQRPIADAKRFADGLLMSAEIRDLREKLGLSQDAAGKVFGGGPNAFYKYENGEVTQSMALDRLMRVARESAEAYHWLRKLAGLSDDSSAHVAHRPVVMLTTRGGGAVRSFSLDTHSFASTVDKVDSLLLKIGSSQENSSVVRQVINQEVSVN